MPQQPDAVFQPDISINIDKTYIIELTALEERPSKFTEKNANAKTLLHHWRIHDRETGIAVLDNATGDVFDLWEWAPDTTYDNPTTGKIAPARGIANALLDKRLSDAEVKELIKDGWSQSLVGRRALADFNWEQTANGERLKVIRLRPYRKLGDAPAPAASTEETPEQKKARLIRELEAMTGVPSSV